MTYEVECVVKEFADDIEAMAAEIDRLRTALADAEEEAEIEYVRGYDEGVQSEQDEIAGLQVQVDELVRELENAEVVDRDLESQLEECRGEQQ